MIKLRTITFGLLFFLMSTTYANKGTNVIEVLNDYAELRTKQMSSELSSQELTELGTLRQQLMKDLVKVETLIEVKSVVDKEQEQINEDLSSVVKKLMNPKISKKSRYALLEKKGELMKEKERNQQKLRLISRFEPKGR